MSTDPTHISDLLKDVLQCPICRGTLCEPVKPTACTHTFCFSCLLSTVRSGRHMGLSCPMCRAFSIDVTVQVAQPLQEIVAMVNPGKAGGDLHAQLAAFNRAHGIQSGGSRLSRVSVDSLRYFARCHSEMPEATASLVHQQVEMERGQAMITRLIDQLAPYRTAAAAAAVHSLAL